MRHPQLALLAALFVWSGCSSSSPQSPRAPAGGDPQIAATTVVVIGQPDFVTSAADAGAGAISARGLRLPVGDAAVVAGRILLPDTGNHRVLSFDALPTENGAAATAVVGQPDPLSGAPSLLPGRFFSPRSVWSDGTRVVVADTGAARVQLVSPESRLLAGWGDGGAYATGCAGDLLADPWRAIVAGARLIVADRSNHRVLVWNTVPTAPRPADLVIGQRDLVHCAANDPIGSGVPGGRSARTLSFPTDVWSDGERLLVADGGNNRVLLWNHFPTVNGAPADLVLGQPDFHVGTAQATQSGMSAPGFVASDGARIVVADVRNNRVLGWRSFPTANGAPADLVLGHEDFVHSGQNGNAGPVSERTLNTPMGVALGAGAVVVTDTSNHRYLVYRLPWSKE